MSFLTMFRKRHTPTISTLSVSECIPAEKRASLIANFLNSSHTGVHLLSTNTCTVGINLQQVSKVIFKLEPSN